MSHGGGVEHEAVPRGVDTTVPHSARVYDAWLGGKDNFAVDRALAAAIQQAIPTIPQMAKANRAFVHRAVQHLVREAGIRQFLDVGTGIPTSPNLHEVAQQIAPDTRVVYVDNDRIVHVHAQALMVSSEQGACEYIHADMCEPAKILTDPALLRTLDLTQPVGVMLVAILMLLPDADDPWAKARTLMDALPSGSHIAITHPTQDFDPDAMATVVAASGQAGLTLVPRTRADVARFFDGWELIEPGMVPVMSWRPDAPPADPHAAYYWAGVARKR